MAWSEKEIQFIKENYLFMTYKELAENVGKTKKQVANELNKLRRKGEDLPIHRKRAVYTYYEKGEFVTSGTLEEISEFTGIKANNLKFYATPSYQNRTSEKSRRLVRIEGEFDFNFLGE